MPRLQFKSFETPDDVHSMPRMHVEMVGLDDTTVGHCRFEPGWRWSTDIAPMLGTTSCPYRHIGYTLAGSLHVVMDDGQTLDIPPRTAFEIPPGHDKWVVGEDAWECIEWGATGSAMQAVMEDAGRGRWSR